MKDEKPLRMIIIFTPKGETSALVNIKPTYVKSFKNGELIIGEVQE